MKILINFVIMAMLHRRKNALSHSETAVSYQLDVITCQIRVQEAKNLTVTKNKGRKRLYQIKKLRRYMACKPMWTTLMNKQVAIV